MDCRHQQGFTLSETLITCFIIASLSYQVLPSFYQLLRTTQLNTQVNYFVSAYTLARSEAINRNQKVTLCARHNQHCHDDQQWENGWIVYVDNNHNGDAETDEIIRLFPPLSPGYQLRPNVAIAALLFIGDGRVTRPNGSLPMMTLRLCAPDATAGVIKERSRELVINASGRMRRQYGREGITAC